MKKRMQITIETMLTAPFLFLLLFVRVIFTECPLLCECKWKNGKETVICLNASLLHIPLHLEAGTQVLDLTGNELTSIKNEEFSRAGLLNLQKIFILKSKLKNLDKYAFKYLNNLIELDLSGNYLSSIPSHCLESIPELRELKLSGNPIQRIENEAFYFVSRLVRLDLSHCKITSIEPRAFRGLERSLEWLKLDENDLKEIQPVTLMRLENLHGLELSNNPWNCSCNIRPVRAWMQEKNVPFGVPPSCQYPKRLKGKIWDKLDLDEFACAPGVYSDDSNTNGIEGKNITLSCKTTGVPEPNVKWFLRNKVIANLSGAAYSNGRKTYLVHVENGSSNLTIFNAEPQDAGTYICVAENRAGKVDVSVTLSISKKSPETALFGKTLVVSVLTGTLFVITSCLIALCVFSVRKKRTAWRNGECTREENYEKIEMNHKAVENLDTSDKKNGEYSVVPARDEEEDVATTSSWKGVEKGWNSPEHLLDPEDLHIPRRLLSHSREGCRENSDLKRGTFKPLSAAPVPSGGSIFASIPREAPDGRSPFSSATYPDDRRFPDLLKKGGSADDVSELFCTLPRKTRRCARSTDSAAPLIDSSRCSSTSFGSQESRMFETLNLNRNRVNSISNIYLNLYKDDRSAKNYKTTPLTNVSVLDRGAVEMHSPNANSYNYHASQLEKFLEEYRCLQKELTRMKETCDYLVNEKKGEAASKIDVVSPNSNRSIEESVDFKNFENELTRYLLSKDGSGKISNTTNLQN